MELKDKLYKDNINSNIKTFCCERPKKKKKDKLSRDLVKWDFKMEVNTKNNSVQKFLVSEHQLKLRAQTALNMSE